MSIWRQKESLTEMEGARIRKVLTDRDESPALGRIDRSTDEAGRLGQVISTDNFTELYRDVMDVLDRKRARPRR